MIGLRAMIASVTRPPSSSAEPGDLVGDGTAALAEGAAVADGPAELLLERRKNPGARANVANHSEAIGLNASAPPTASLPILKKR